MLGTCLVYLIKLRYYLPYFFSTTLTSANEE